MGGSAAVGLELGKRLAGPKGEQGYLAVTGLATMMLVPLTLGLGVVCAVWLLWRRRSVLLFIVSAIPHRAFTHLVAVIVRLVVVVRLVMMASAATS